MTFIIIKELMGVVTNKELMTDNIDIYIVTIIITIIVDVHNTFGPILIIVVVIVDDHDTFGDILVHLFFVVH